MNARKEQSSIALSVLIPTYNRAAVLRKQLDAFRSVEIPDGETEIVVIDDGSTDGTDVVVREIQDSGHLQFSLFFIRQSNSGPAAARNRGIEKARGRVVLILNDDSIPDQKLLVEHLKSHDLYPADNYGVLGFCTWDPSLKITPFMKWLENGGPYFSYSSIKGTWASWTQLWTCNVSFKRRFIRDVGMFDEDFPYAAWEDIEMGYRMHRLGLKLFYNRDAVVWHDHAASVESVIGKMRSNGAAAVIMGNKIDDKSVLPPLARRVPSAFLRAADRVVFLPPIVWAMWKIAVKSQTVLCRPILYSLLLLHYRIAGQREYLRKHS